MDREKAADLLDNLIGMVEDNHGADYDTALKMGIEALSTSGDGPEPVDDTISRQAAIDALNRIGSLDTDADMEYAKGIFERLPSAQPKEVFEFDKPYPLAGLQVEITKGAYGDDFITIKRPERFLALDGVVYTQDDDRQGWRGEQDG